MRARDKRRRAWRCAASAVRPFFSRVRAASPAGCFPRSGRLLPKGTLDLKLPSQKTLFEFHADRTRALQREVGGPAIPFFVMTSTSLGPQTRAIFEEAGFFGLEEEQVRFFEQGVLPCVGVDGKLFFEEPGKVSQSVSQSVSQRFAFFSILYCFPSICA